MGVPGREPKPGSINHHALTVDWTEVEDKPYTGPKPALPKSRTIITSEGPEAIPLDPQTIAWWDVVSSMPHAILWKPSDWLLATSTAALVDMFHTGKHSVATELRRREQELGMTPESRRKMRLRYVEPAAPVAKKRPAPARAKTTKTNVTAINERRRRAIESQ